MKYRETRASTVKAILVIDYSRKLELFEGIRHTNGSEAVSVFLMFRATLTSWPYVLTKNHMKKHQKNISSTPGRNGPEAFMRPLLNHRDVIDTGRKKVGKASRDNTEARDRYTQR